MTVEEGVEFFEDIARLEYDLVDSYHTDEGVYGKEESYHREKAEHHEQVAMWLKELKSHREAWGKVKRTVKAYLMLEEFGSAYQDDIENLIEGCRPKEGDNE